MNQREIKFRAWDRENKEMGEVVEILFDQYGGMDVRTSRRMGINATALGPSTLSQYTGLKDKNGKEIYEGDIMKTVMKPEMIDVFWKVVWAKNEDGNMWGWMCKTEEGMYILDNSLQEHGKVIGNIYENPELICPKAN